MNGFFTLFLCSKSSLQVVLHNVQVALKKYFYTLVKIESMLLQLQQIDNDVNQSVLSFIAQKQDRLTIKILDAQGKISKTLVTFVEKGKQDLTLNLNDLTNGIYVLNAFLGDAFLKSFRIIKQ